MITISLPKSTRFLQPTAKFSAQFNVPVLGKYSFSTAGNTGVSLIDPIGLSSVYLIDNINVGGTIPESEYLSAIGANAFPALRLRYKIDNQALYPYPLQIVNYIDNQQTLAWVVTTKGNDALLADFSGTLDQTTFLVGMAAISVVVSFNIYQITDSAFVKAFAMADSESSIAMQTGNVRVPSVYLPGVSERRL
jgi:hypothetical protein